MTVINTNTAAINAQYNLSKVQSAMDDAMSALSSGKRVTSAADDAAGLSIITRMESQVRGLNQAMKNAADGQNMVATAEGAMEEMTNMLQRMRELALQAANDTMNQQDRNNLNNEMEQLKTEIDRVVENTRFNDQVLLDGSQQGTTLQIGTKSGETMAFNIADMSTSSLGSSASAVDGTGSVSASAQGTAAVENVVNLTFNGNDSYDFVITLDDQTVADGTQERITISGGEVSGYSAQDVADKINTAIAATGATGYAERDLNGILTASASGNTVTLINKAGTEIDITSFASDGSGTMTVNPVTNTTADSVTLENTAELTSMRNLGGTQATASTAALQLEAGKSFKFRVNDTLITVDTTTAGLAADGHADAAAAFDQAVIDIRNAIDATSGAGEATVAKVAGAASAHFTIDMSDATGNDIEISGFQKVTSSMVEDGFFTVDTDISANSITIIENDEYLTTDQDTSADNSNSLTIATNKTGRIQFSNQDLSYTFGIDWTDQGGGAESYTIDGAAEDFNAEIDRVAALITAHGGLNVTASNNGGSLEIVNNDGTNAITFDGDLQVASDGYDAVTEGAAYFAADSQADADTTGDDDLSGEAGVVAMVEGAIVRSTDGVNAVASQMSLSFSGNDRYSFSIDANGGGDGDADATVSADVLNGNLEGIRNVVNSHTATTGVTATIQGDELVLEKADGTAFDIHTFSSESGGQITAANAAGQGGSGVLENAGDGASVNIAESGAAVATEVVLTMSATAHADEKYSFKITDGSSTATVRATGTAAAVAADADTADLLAEIQSALSAANMSHITAAVSGSDDGTIVLTNALGGNVDIENFQSDKTGTMTVSPSSGQGVGKILDDDAISGAYDSVASIDALSASTAQLAVQAIDRALENINSQRSELGAISNRLDHTINNLGNVVVNTEASQSRIEDADFATETSNLTKAQILSQAATAMLAQANASKQSVLSLLQG